MRELLIRYLLGELEPHEHDAVQQQLAASPELRRELAQLRSCFAASCRDDEPDEPPRGLAERTSVWVAESDSYDALPKRGTAIADAHDPPAGVLGWSLADLTVAGGVILAVSMLLFPALRDSRDGSRRVQCQNNQRQLGRLFLAFADNNGGYMPWVQPNENSGIFAVRLVERNYISAEDLKRLLVCPDSPQAKLIKAHQAMVMIPTQEELNGMSEDELAKARAWMSPTYAYCFGFRVGNQYHYIPSGGFRTPVLCDAPGTEGDGMSPNHSGAVNQVLFADGRVAVLTSVKLQAGQDDFFHSIRGVVEAGFEREDSVLGRSEATPGIFFINSDSAQADVLQLRKPHLSRGNVLPAIED